MPKTPQQQEKGIQCTMPPYTQQDLILDLENKLNGLQRQSLGCFVWGLLIVFLWVIGIILGLVLQNGKDKDYDNQRNELQRDIDKAMYQWNQLTAVHLIRKHFTYPEEILFRLVV